MTVKSAQAITVLFATANPTTGAAADATGTPSGTLYVNGVANAATVTVTNVTTGVYKAAVTLPALTAGDIVSLRVAATVATIAGEAVVWQDVGDTERLSDLATASALTSGVSNLQNTVDGIATDLATVDGIVDDILLDTGTDGVKLAAGAVTAAAIATGAIDADALATDAVAELAAGTWSATTRTLTQSAASVTAAVSGSNISIQRGDVVTINLAALGSIADRTKLWFTVKHSRDDLDPASIIQIEETAGLLYLNGAATTTSNATLTVTDVATGAITIVLEAAASAALTPCGAVYDVQQLTASGPVTLTAGDVEITADVTRAVA
jgi:hypothetical protein